MVSVQLDRGFNQTIYQFVKICPLSDFPLRIDFLSQIYKKECYIIVKDKVDFQTLLPELIKLKSVKPRPDNYESDLIVFGICHDEPGQGSES